MFKNYSPFVCHFHRCDTITWLHVKSVLDRLVLRRVESGKDVFAFSLSADSWLIIQEFCKQMDISYIHPRRDSFHIELSKSRYGDFHVPESFLAERLKKPTA